MIRRMLRVAVILVALGMTVSGCGFTGINSQQLPFTKGGGDDAMTIQVRVQNAVNLVPNSEVKVDDMTVGSVRDIEFANWRATLTIGLEPSVHLPANAVARIGQKSLLGAKYLELASPKNAQPRGKLTDGAVIPTSRSGRYPETEKLLGAASMLLNGGGLANLKTINTELNRALSGRETDVRKVIDNIDTFTGSLNAQRHDLVRTLEQMNRLAGTLSGQKEVLARGLDTIPRGLRVLDQEREHLVNTMDAVADFGDVANRVLNGSREQLVANLRDLRPVLRELADAGRNLPGAADSIVHPFSVDALTTATRGDYLNFFAQLDLTLPALDRNFLSGTPLEGVLIGGEGLLSGGTGTERVNPLRAPIERPQQNSPQQPSQSAGDPGRDGAHGDEPRTVEQPHPDGTSSSEPSAPGQGNNGDVVGELLNPTQGGDG